MEPHVLGRCPECERDIPRGGALIEYETSSDGTSVYAECPACAAVVHPVRPEVGR